jgi:hypothetical protein
VKVPGGLGFAEFKGYETWETVAVSYNGKAIAVILGNPAMISAFKAGIPDNGKPVPDGARMAKVHWVPKMNQFFPTRRCRASSTTWTSWVKDSKRFADGNGWGYAVFRYDAATDTFTPGTTADTPPQGERRQVRGRLPQHREEAGLRLHGVRAQVNARRTMT